MQKSDIDETCTPPKNPVPLRTILRNFLNLVESYECRKHGDVDLYEDEFQELKLFSENLKSDSYYQTKEGERNVNRKKNRYKDILPFDFSRVTLSDVGDIPGSDYVNANFIKGASGSLAYIACQGPLPHTVNDFWRMVIESEVQVIVMACMEQESGKHKCENYWVEEDGVEREFGQVTVWLKKCRNVCSDFLVRTMRIRFPNKKGEMEERNVCQFHYSAWPDHGIPTKVRPLLDMVRLIRDCQTSETLPVLVHCSAGCGRTGTICAIDYVWGLLRLGKLTEDFSLFNLVREMRRQRIAMVQTKDQYILVHRAVKELFQEQLKIIDAHPYANVDQYGLPVEIRHELEEPTYATIDFQCKGPMPPSPAKPFLKQLLKENNNLKPRTSMKIPIWKGSNQKVKDQSPLNFGGSSIKIKKDETDLRDAANIHEDNIGKSVNAGEDTVDCSSFPVHKVSPPAISPNRGGSILRKPSIVKLRALFEKTSKSDKDCPKKADVTINGLSRAKSDVSASSRFYSFATSFSGSKTSVESVNIKASPNKDDAKQQKKAKQSKPPILAKTAMAVKRSKSLKIHPEDGPKTSLDAETKPTCQDPIKVCVKQTEMPQLQHVVGKSVKGDNGQEYELLTHRGGRRDSLEKLINPSVSEKLSILASLKPPLPAKTHGLVYDYQKSEKTNIADDFENARSSSFLKSTEMESITPKSAILVGSVMAPNGCLTRSQSHVWQSTKAEPSLTNRMFSNENIYKSEQDTKNEVTSGRRGKESDPGLRLEPMSVKHKNQLEIGKIQNDSTLSPILSNPIARRRLPKVAVYSNHPVEHRDSGNSSLKERFTPPFALSGMAYTSDSSNSLPSTPTQSIDRRNTENGHDSPNLYNHQAPVLRPILKGSLSSTPSDSDELLDLNRPKYASTTVVTISSGNPVTVNNMLSRSHLPIGLRERRNSFRQAVWKEVQVEGEQNNLQTEYGGDPSQKNGNEPLLSAHRAHKDYEPIWPSHGNDILSRQGNENGHSSTPTLGGNVPLAGNSQMVKSRIHEFNGLLDELQATNGLRAPTTANVGSSKCQEPKKSPTLKYHRSLKAPSRSDYEHSHQGISGGSTLSCFTFKKPTSLESIADQLQAEGRTGKKSAFSFLSRGQRDEDQRKSSTSSGFHSGRYANDYVTLEQCRTDSSCGFRVETEDEVDQRMKGRYQHNNGDIPVPPPRTKAKRLNSQQLDIGGSQGSRGTERSDFLVTTGSNLTNGEGSNRRRMKSGDSTNASPISSTRIKALGIFHDMKSKLVHWTEHSGQDRSPSHSSGTNKRGSQESNGSNSSGNRDSPWSHGNRAENNGISRPSLTERQAAASSSRPTSKHQYL